jgi:CRISPR-associated protein Cas2
MRVIVVYDVATEFPQDQTRLNKVKNVCRKYLHHLQKSVFEGDLTISQLERLKSELLSVVDKERDFVVVYTIENPKSLSREIITDTEDPTDNLI